MGEFAVLGLEPRLGWSEGEIREAFRAASRERHPDAGGSGFERLEEAQRRLLSPAGRLRAWLRVHGREADGRGVVEGSLMDLFVELGPVLQRADELRRERSAARSALGRALLEPRAQAMREELEAMQDRIAALVDERVAGFAEIEQGRGDPAGVLRDLGFLEKWQGELRSRFGDLW